MFDLRKRVEQFYVDLSLCAKAREVWTIANRYAASAWPHGCNRNDMPQRYPGIPTDQLRRAFKSGAIMPLAERHLRDIFAA